MFVIQHQLGNFHLDNKTLNQICHKTNQNLWIRWPFQSKLDYDSIIFETQMAFD